ncbi:MAG: hypothetical protein ABIJ34_08640 [archaeon]
MNYFNQPEFLEPKCAHCGVLLDYGVNTVYNEEASSHVCSACGHKI